jgi:hypothetical protein
MRVFGREVFTGPLPSNAVAIHDTIYRRLHYKLMYHYDAKVRLAFNWPQVSGPNILLSTLFSSSVNVRDKGLTSWSSVLLEKLPIVKLLKNFPAFYGIQRLITVFTTAL